MKRLIIVALSDVLLKIPACTASVEQTNGVHVSTVITQVSVGEKVGEGVAASFTIDNFKPYDEDGKAIFPVLRAQQVSRRTVITSRL